MPRHARSTTCKACGAALGPRGNYCTECHVAYRAQQFRQSAAAETMRLAYAAEMQALMEYARATVAATQANLATIRAELQEIIAEPAAEPAAQPANANAEEDPQ